MIPIMVFGRGEQGQLKEEAFIAITRVNGDGGRVARLGRDGRGATQLHVHWMQRREGLWKATTRK